MRLSTELTQSWTLQLPRPRERLLDRLGLGGIPLRGVPQGASGGRLLAPVPLLLTCGTMRPSRRVRCPPLEWPCEGELDLPVPAHCLGRPRLPVGEAEVSGEEPVMYLHLGGTSTQLLLIHPGRERSGGDGTCGRTERQLRVMSSTRTSCWVGDREAAGCRWRLSGLKGNCLHRRRERWTRRMALYEALMWGCWDPDQRLHGPGGLVSTLSVCLQRCHKCSVRCLVAGWGMGP